MFILCNYVGIWEIKNPPKQCLFSDNTYTFFVFLHYLYYYRYWVIYIYLMRWTIFFLCFLCIFSYKPLSANLEFYFEDETIYDNTRITSPEDGWWIIYIRHTPRLVPIPRELITIETISRETIESIVRTILSEEIEQTELEQFITEAVQWLNSIENTEFTTYLTVAVSQETEQIIQNKIENNIILSPYEQIFLDCNIDLYERQEITIDILRRLNNWEIETLENVSYMNPDFGNCIIPFPDSRFSSWELQEWEYSSLSLYQNQELQFEVSEDIEKLIRNNEETFTVFWKISDTYSVLRQNNQISQATYLRISDEQEKTQACLSILTQEDISQLNEESFIFFWDFQNSYNKISHHFLDQFKAERLELRAYIEAQMRLGLFACNFSEILTEYNQGNHNEDVFYDVYEKLQSAFEIYYRNILSNKLFSYQKNNATISVFTLIIIVLLLAIWWYIIRTQYSLSKIWKK